LEDQQKILAASGAQAAIESLRRATQPQMQEHIRAITRIPEASLQQAVTPPAVQSVPARFLASVEATNRDTAQRLLDAMRPLTVGALEASARQWAGRHLALNLPAEALGGARVAALGTWRRPCCCPTDHYAAAKRGIRATCA
jgi:hypothetical protein